MSKKHKHKHKVKSINKKTYKPIYTQEDYSKDEAKLSSGLKNGNIDWNAFSRLMINDLCHNSNILSTGCIGDFKVDDIEIAIANPQSYWKTLLRVSKKLMLISPHYYRLNTLYSNMALFLWSVDIYGVKENANITTLKKSYCTLVEKLENMNLKHEFSKIVKVLPYQDIYCGLICENQNDFFIQQIDYSICKLYEVQDGLYNFAINLSAINPSNINAYPLYIRNVYEKFKHGELDSNWYKPSADLQICIKLNSQWTFPYPLLIGLVKDLLDLDKYKKLKLQSARTDNYKAIMVEVPIDKNVVDKPLLTPDTLGVFAEINRESLSDDIGLIYNVGSSGEAISFKNSTNTRNNVSDSVDTVYDSAGITKELFNGSSSATAVTFSVENDSGIIYGVYRQFERWINRYIKIRKYNKTSYKFSFSLLDATVFNRDVVSKRYKDAISIGATVIDKYMASLGITPSVTMGSFITNNIIFDFHNNFMPLATTYTTSGDDVGGRPTNEEKGKLLTDSGERSLDE